MKVFFSVTHAKYNFSYVARRGGPGWASHSRLPGYKACTLTFCQRCIPLAKWLKHIINWIAVAGPSTAALMLPYM